MAKQSRKKTVPTSEFEHLAKEFISSTLGMSEQCLWTGKAKGATRTAIPHAAMSVLYAVKAFVALTKQCENDE